VGLPRTGARVPGAFPLPSPWTYFNCLQLSPDWTVDYESYTWKKLDPNDAKTKEMVKEYFLWEGNFDGKKFHSGKIFK
jgi:hypothetical protein